MKNLFKRLNELDDRIDRLNSRINDMELRIWGLENPPKFKKGDHVWCEGKEWIVSESELNRGYYTNYYTYTLVTCEGDFCKSTDVYYTKEESVC